MSITKLNWSCGSTPSAPENTFHLCGWWAVQHCGWGQGGQWESDSRHRHQKVSVDFESFPNKSDHRAERRGFSLFLFSDSYRVGGVVLENCVVVLAGFLVPSETQEHRLQRLLTDSRPWTHNKSERIKSRQHNHTPVHIVAGSYDYSEAVQKSVVTQDVK